MKKIDRIREKLSILPTSLYLSKMHDAGWSLVALEWERPAEEDQAPAQLHEVPFGFRIAPDCVHLEDDPGEKRALTVMMEVITKDKPLSQVAAELNRRGFRTRRDASWTPLEVFNMLPRLVETGPAIFASAEWLALKTR